MITTDYSIANGKGKRALLINPPIYDTRYWDRWSQPYGLLKIAANLRQKGYQIELIDCLYTDSKSRRVKQFRKKIQVGDVLMTIYHFGLSLAELRRRLNQLEYIPDQIYVTSIMTYWWESTKDVIEILKDIFPKSEVILGGIYPTLCPNHAAENTRADIVVVGEVKEASDLWTDLSFYPNPPDYAVITSSRGCPYDCAHCAQKQINGVEIRHRNPEDVVDEITDKCRRYGIKKFAFYEDNILIDCKEHFERIIDLILKKQQKLHLSAPEGFEVRLLYPELLKKMKAAGFQSIYLPLEVASFDDMMRLDQKNVHLDDFEKAVEFCRQAGYKPGIRQELNAFILYGVPNQPLDKLVEAILYAAHLVGNVTPMLYTPVPGSRLYKKYENYFIEKHLNLEDLNGKLFPFWEMSNLNPSDYIALQRLMYALHTQLRGMAFDLLDDNPISRLVRESLINWEQR
jgi:radical SAM superfamily enzyme YgiQ (UPF0313 family)